ncbi:MAG: hypothetical protein IJR71_03160, partial [Prevotella sp.]|nr:hypothetical protein [Prevotella sp.]
RPFDFVFLCRDSAMCKQVCIALAAPSVDFVFLCRDSAMCKQVCIALAAPSVFAKADIKQAWAALLA